MVSNHHEAAAEAIAKAEKAMKEVHGHHIDSNLALAQAHATLHLAEEVSKLRHAQETTIHVEVDPNALANMVMKAAAELAARQ